MQMLEVMSPGYNIIHVPKILHDPEDLDSNSIFLNEVFLKINLNKLKYLKIYIKLYF
jgi:hypothetical protein